MTGAPENRAPEQAPPPKPRRGLLDPILSNRDGLFSALEERGRPLPAPTAREPWAHRRGEPRTLLLCWATYLLAASGATIMRLPQIGFTEPRFVQSATRLLVLLIAIGLVALWPALRLSQASPRRPVVATLVDYAALAAPLLAVLWPVTWLGRWGVEVTLALIATIAAWGLLIGPLIALGVRRDPGPARSLWALAVVAAILAGPALAFALPPIGVPSAVFLYASPLTAIYALTSESTARLPTMTPAEWWAAIAPAALGLFLWAVAAVAPPASRPPVNSPERS